MRISCQSLSTSHSGFHDEHVLYIWYESGFRPSLCTYRLNWARRTSWGWWDDWDDTALQTQDSKFKPWRSEAEHATSRSRRLPTILTFTRGWGRNIFVSFKLSKPGTEPRTLAWKAAVLTTTLGPPPNMCCSLLTQIATRQRKNNIFILRQAMSIRVSSAARRHRSGRLVFLLSYCCIELPQSQQSFLSSTSQCSLTCLTRRFLSVGGVFSPLIAKPACLFTNCHIITVIRGRCWLWKVQCDFHEYKLKYAGKRKLNYKVIIVILQWMIF